jgi:hypothetical protein
MHEPPGRVLQIEVIGSSATLSIRKVDEATNAVAREPQAEIDVEAWPLLCAIRAGIRASLPPTDAPTIRQAGDD